MKTLSPDKTRPPPERAKLAIWGWWARVARPAGGIAIVFCVHCGDADYCEQFDKGLPCPKEEGGGGQAGSGQGGAGGGGNGGTGGDGGSGGGVPAECDLVEGEAIGATCGIFVKAGAAGDGSQGSPYGTIQDAVDNIKTATRIYVCGGDTFNGSVELPGGVSLYGALDCDGWKFADANAKPHILGDADIPALAITEAGTTRIDHIDVESPSAVAVGASSIAVLVRTTTVTLDHCSLTAGDGAKGEAGAPFGATAQPGGMGMQGSQGCQDGNVHSGGAPGMNPVCVDQAGGGGGQGQSGGTGGPGGPGDPSGTGGLGGVGQGVAGACTGGEGDSGGPGEPGLAGSGIGQLEGSDYTPAQAPAGGGPGDPGYGGGGGGGAHKCETNFSGPGGGGGGAGGCGGAAGRGGFGGGASFALAVITADVTVVDSTLTAGTGGEGGDGGAGQLGGLGGDGGPKGIVNGSNGSAADACSGGKGGAGGRGGAGGGGAAGPSAAIARVDSTVDRQGTVVATPGSSGSGGVGGDNEGQGSSGPQGDPGAVCEVLVFDGSATGQCNNG